MPSSFMSLGLLGRDARMRGEILPQPPGSVADLLRQGVNVRGLGHPPPVVLLAVLREVRCHARDGRLAPVRERAAAVIHAIDQSFEFRLTRMLLRADVELHDDGPALYERLAAGGKKPRDLITAAIK